MCLSLISANGRIKIGKTVQVSVNLMRRTIILLRCWNTVERIQPTADVKRLRMFLLYQMKFPV